MLANCRLPGIENEFCLRLEVSDGQWGSVTPSYLGYCTDLRLAPHSQPRLMEACVYDNHLHAHSCSDCDGHAFVEAFDLTSILLVSWKPNKPINAETKRMGNIVSGGEVALNLMWKAVSRFRKSFRKSDPDLSSPSQTHTSSERTEGETQRSLPVYSRISPPVALHWQFVKVDGLTNVFEPNQEPDEFQAFKKFRLGKRKH
ncbi:hypothetical protein GQ44DRAFT_215639 [Phaeosphaeriaceae sp. PMI808]|nr:hypothetical protein GQ44DRAFT_215639 [Phaeosphaeriaceae sp. PMI808]